MFYNMRPCLVHVLQGSSNLSSIFYKSMFFKSINYNRPGFLQIRPGFHENCPGVSRFCPGFLGKSSNRPRSMFYKFPFKIAIYNSDYYQLGKSHRMFVHNNSKPRRRRASSFAIRDLINTEERVPSEMAAKPDLPLRDHSIST